jgi:ABC-2 type transport system permease protein
MSALMFGTGLRPYRAVFAARFLMMLQYRAAAFAGIVTQFWFGAINVLVLAGFYASGEGKAAITLPEAVTYIWLAQAFLGLLPWTVDPEIAAMMRTGNVAYEQLRPVDTYCYWFARAMAWRTASTLLRSVPLIAVTGLLFPSIGLIEWSLRPPPSAESFVVFVLSMAATVILASAITTMLNICVIWTVSGQGVTALTNSLVLIFSGMVIPLPLFPDWAQTALLCQPLAGLVDIPYRIYFGNLTGAGAVAAVGLQCFWALIVIWLGRLFMARTMRRVQVQGG